MPVERRDPGFDDKIAWLRQILDWKDAVAGTGEWLAAFRSSLFTDSIYVLTPQGKVVDLPQGATPIDFAYAVHTSLGHRCRGARVDGQMVPLDYALRNGQRVEIIAAKQGGPSRDWLNPELGYVLSHRARTKVRQWFKAQQLDETVAQGRAMVERELARLGQTALKLETVAAKAGFAKTDDLFAAFARDEINSKQVQAAIHAVAQPGDGGICAPASPKSSCARAARPARASGILVVGVDRLMTGLARCCKPAPPDPIVGFVTRGKGITIHRAACANVGADPRARARAADRGELGRAARRAVPGRHRRRGERSAGTAARHLGAPVAREDQRHGGEHADAPASGAYGVHARGRERCAVEARVAACA